ncbi:MAG: hypothetical protein ABIP33_06415 [Pseudolysinimonas sp.]
MPAFPLPNPSARERAVWKTLWRTPQAAMWDIESWRKPAVGLYCRLFVRSEALDANASLVAQLHRLGDQLGLTPAGLKENGWRLAIDEVSAKRESTATTKPATRTRPQPVRRPRIVSA